jgi:small subunit ribosomal protein S16
MLSLRLARVGRKNQPWFRITVTDKRFDPRGKYLEILGFFNPRDRKNTMSLKEDRIKYWLEKGAQTTPTIHNILIDKGLIPGPKKKATSVHQKDKKQEQPQVQPQQGQSQTAVTT